MFFFAFLPQFVPPHAPREFARLLLLSGVFIGDDVHRVRHLRVSAVVRRHVIGRSKVVQRTRRLLAASFVGLGVKLATTSR